MQLIVSWVTLSVGLWITGLLVPGFHVKGFGGALVVGAVFGILHWAIGWLIFTVIGVATLFIGFIFAFITWWIVTAIVLKMTDALTDSLTIVNFRTALIASAVLSLLSVVSRLLIR